MMTTPNTQSVTTADMPTTAIAQGAGSRLPNGRRVARRAGMTTINYQAGLGM